MLKYLDKIVNNSPKFNDYTVKSMAYMELRNHSIPYIDETMASIIVDIPGFEYKGITELSIDDEVVSNVNPNLKTKKDYDVSITYKRKYRLLYTFEGEEIPGGYLYVPFVTDKGIIISSDTRYHIIPVITDSVITITTKYIFLRLRKDKLFIDSDTHHFFKNGLVTYNNLDHSERLYKNKKIPGKVGNVLLPIGTYILNKYGIKGLIKDKDIKLFYGDRAAANELKDTHDIYNSLGKAPLNRITDGYNASKLIVCIKKGTMNQLELNTLTTIFYVTDVFPTMVKDLVKIINNDDKENEEIFWKHIIARLVFRDTVDISNAIEAINTHLLGLRNYIDSVIEKKLNEIGFYPDDFFDLLRMLSMEGINMKLEQQKAGDNTKDKYLDILYYLFYPLIVNANNLTSQLKGLIRKGSLNMDNVTKAIGDNIRPRCLFNSFKTDAMSLAIMPASTSIDWAAGGITNSLELQERGDGVIRNTSHTMFPVNKRHLVAGDLLLGNMLHLPKDWPTPSAKLNPFARINTSTYRIEPTEEEDEKLRIINLLIVGKVYSEREEQKLKELTND